jgi:alcohol dehydrogenase, propanol-preferring
MASPLVPGQDSPPQLPGLMRAMVLEAAGSPLRAQMVSLPEITDQQVLLRVHTCGVCRTDLHVCDGELPSPSFPLIPGHQVVGTVVAVGSGVSQVRLGDRVGVPWVGWTCGVCPFCSSQQENLCPNARFTGYTLPGGYAEYCSADARYCLPLPPHISNLHAAPLLCAGLIGYRAFRFCGDAEHIGFLGFGAAAHILTQIAVRLERKIYAMTRPGDLAGQRFSLSLGARWAGDTTQTPPHVLDAAIIFAPDGTLVPVALKLIRPGGLVVCAGIHMSDVPSFPYALLWQERTLRSVANLTRADGVDFFSLLSKIPVHTQCQPFSLSQANEALQALRSGKITGAAVLTVS